MSDAAQVLLGPEPSRSVFRSQQAAEKAVKAFLTLHQIPFRKTHDLADLGLQCASVDPSLERILREVADLTDYASAFHDPNRPWIVGKPGIRSFVKGQSGDIVSGRRESAMLYER